MGGSVAGKPEVTPLDVAILYLLYFARRGMCRTTIMEAVEPFFGKISAGDLMGALNALVMNMRYIDVHHALTEDGKNLVLLYSLTPMALKDLFSWPTRGRRAGSELHNETIRTIVNQQMRQVHYSRPRIANELKSKPYAIIMEPKTVECGERTVYSMSRWNENTALAVVVESDRARHGGQAYTNWKKHFNAGLNVWFLTFSMKRRAAIRRTLDSHGVSPGSCIVTNIPREVIGAGNNIMIEVPCISSHRKLAGRGGKKKTKAPLMGVVEYDVWKALDADNYRTCESVRDAVMAQTGTSTLNIDNAIKTLSNKKIIRTYGGKAIRHKHASAIYENMIRNGLPVVKNEKPGMGESGKKTPQDMLEGPQPNLRGSLEKTNEQKLHNMVHSKKCDDATKAIIREILKKRGWTV